MKKEWSNTVDVVANAMAALQMYTARTKKRDLSIDTMTLMSLIHSIGVLPILTEAERHTEVFASPSFLDDAIDKLAPKVGGSIMRSWEFGEDFVVVAERWHDLAYIPEKLGYIDFVRVGAALAGQINNKKDAVLNLAIQRGVVEDINSLLSDDFAEMRAGAKQIFA
tara:strand:- start:104 stop:601 length:498 start_codon:yes stop_codon:yes gene_type:complete